MTSRVIQKLIDDPRVSEVSDERGSDDGFWVYLKPGWIWQCEVHCVHEDTPSACLIEMRGVESCNCSDYCTSKGDLR